MPLLNYKNKFCSLWNEVVQKAEGGQSHYVRVLRAIRHLYIALHQGTDAAPTAFDASTAYFDSILDQLSSYPSCNIPSHHSNSSVLPETQLDDPPDGSPHPSCLEIQPSITSLHVGFQIPRRGALALNQGTNIIVATGS